MLEKIYYGSETSKIDITDFCLKDNKTFLIPAGDEARAKLFTDPHQGVLKRITFELPDGTVTSYSSNNNIILTRNGKCFITILYGNRELSVDVTAICLKNAIEDVIYIPNGDQSRLLLFNVDPLPGILKQVYIIHDNVERVYKPDSKIYIDITENRIYQIDTLPDKINQIESIYDRLNRFHNLLRLKHGEFKDEYPEQIMSMRYIKGHEKVLEIGANIGRNTLIIAKLLTDARNLVSVECDELFSRQLYENKILNGFDFNIENAAISRRPLIQQGWSTIVSDILLEGYKPVKTVTYPDLVKKWNIKFDTLVLDCEGAFYYILLDFPEIIENVNLIIMENDYQEISHKNYIDTILIKNGFYVDFSLPGGWGPCRDFFYQVWKR